MSLKDTNGMTYSVDTDQNTTGMANSVDTDQTAPP